MTREQKRRRYINRVAGGLIPAPRRRPAISSSTGRAGPGSGAREPLLDNGHTHSRLHRASRHAGRAVARRGGAGRGCFRDESALLRRLARLDSAAREWSGGHASWRLRLHRCTDHACCPPRGACALRVGRAPVVEACLRCQVRNNHASAHMPYAPMPIGSCPPPTAHCRVPPMPPMSAAPRTCSTP